jgi:hypothetical protein
MATRACPLLPSGDHDETGASEYRSSPIARVTVSREVHNNVSLKLNILWHKFESNAFIVKQPCFISNYC